jgi:hypothetical protein
VFAPFPWVFTHGYNEPPLCGEEVRHFCRSISHLLPRVFRNLLKAKKFRIHARKFKMEARKFRIVFRKYFPVIRKFRIHARKFRMEASKR